MSDDRTGLPVRPPRATKRGRGGSPGRPFRGETGELTMTNVKVARTLSGGGGPGGPPTIGWGL